MRKDQKPKSAYQKYLENKDNPAWLIQNERLEEQRERARELDEKRRAIQTQQQMKKQKAKEEKELMAQIENEAKKAIYSALDEFFK